MGLFKRKKNNQESNRIESDIEKKSIQRMNEVKDILVSKGRYFSKPYSFKEIDNILARNQSVTIYAKIGDKEVLFGKIDGENNMLKRTKYFLGSKLCSTSEELFNDQTILGYAIKDNWDKVNIIIMLDDKEQQVL